MRRGGEETLALTRERIAASHPDPPPDEGSASPRLSGAKIAEFLDAAVAPAGPDGLWLP